MFPWHAVFYALSFYLFRLTSFSILWRNIHIYLFKVYNKRSITSLSRTSYKIVYLTKLNNYLQYHTSEKEVNININVNMGTENSIEKSTMISGKLIIAVYASVFHLYTYTFIYIHIYSSLFIYFLHMWVRSASISFPVCWIRGLGWGAVRKKFRCKSVDNNWDGVHV
jgi:hypothetical protein